MFRRTSTSAGVALALLLAAGLLAGCSDGGQSSGAQGSEAVDLTSLQEGILGEDTGGEPVEGGQVTMAVFAEPRSLDPTVSIAALSTGGVEMLNIYDSLMRYDAEAQEFEPRLAKTLETEDNRTWTMTLRDDVTFSNGKPLDAAAVQASQTRYATASAPEAALWNDNVANVSTPDDRTVVYELKRPWAQFPGILSTGPGMVVAKESTRGEDFTPIGAGPFTLESWDPQEAMVLQPREDYWGGAPNLDSLRFVYLPNATAAIESMDGGQVDMIYVREPDQVEEVLSGDAHGYVNFVASGNSAIINAGKGRPGSDPRVRQAMQLAINPEIITTRAFRGAEGGTSTVFPDYSRWHSDVDGLDYDPDRAKELLKEAKADGYDGAVEWTDGSDPASRETALAIKAMWEAVGFDVDVHIARTTSDQITKATEQDFDVMAWGFSFREADPFPKMFATLHSDGTQTYGGATSPEMDSLLEEFQVADSLADQQSIMEQVQEQVNDDVPFLSFGAYAEMLSWTEDVHDVVGTVNSMVMFDRAWKG
ncbi:MAG: ABC transporter substrate-binding protein [Nocardioides sp.]|nr:ABC transporter substrate-binding protein [Nocardioides sp.]